MGATSCCASKPPVAINVVEEGPRAVEPAGGKSAGSSPSKALGTPSPGVETKVTDSADPLAMYSFNLQPVDDTAMEKWRARREAMKAKRGANECSYGTNMRKARAKEMWKVALDGANSKNRPAKAA
mmetsp:Transcript_42005/g.121798  ORF Transcript_42005/g.121798 Transcript_42005/m.121798 type:complete len:126 (-) Transcript_42005:208-585(-)